MDKPENAVANPPWLCPNGHILGFISYSADHIRRLHICTDWGTIIITGEALVPCPICRQVRAWSPGAYCLRNILRNTNRRSKHS